MKTTPNIVKILLISVASLLVIFAALSYNWQSHKSGHLSDATTKEFYQLLEAQRPSIDLSTIKSVEWDSLVFLSPYSDVCQYGIDGYRPDGSNCFASHDDGECWLLFLQDNKLVTKVRIDRKRLDLTTANFPQRLPRNKAKLHIEGDGDFAPVTIQNHGSIP